MSSEIQCPFCKHIPPREKLYSMGIAFNIYNDEYQLRCSKCNALFIVGYTEYYNTIERKK